MSTTPIIVWLRKDLRLRDNPALYQAIQEGKLVVPVFIWAPSEEGVWRMGEAQQWWLHHSLKALSSSLKKQGLHLVLRRGPSESSLYRLAEETGARNIYWNRVYEPIEASRDSHIVSFLQKNGVEATVWESQLLHDPTQVMTGKGTPYKVFTPFWKTIKKSLVVPPPLEISHVRTENASLSSLHSLHIEELELLPSLNWADKFPEFWQPGEQTALQTLDHFLGHSVTAYEQDRDIPSKAGTSRLSPHLHFGEISPRTIWHEITKAPLATDLEKNKEPWLRQLVWREFAYHLIHHFPHTSDHNLREQFNRFSWSTDKEHLVLWQKGKTGYPIVDAGMRQLWLTGWMHNRVRMIVASFLTKHLLMHWIEGARWFWDTLVDANLPNNTMGWQWSAGSGADAQPFFRIFNPITQGKKFDPTGEYVRTWVPELENVPTAMIHEPWLMSFHHQQQANVILGKNYPKPIVDHKEARERALNAYRNISK